VDRHVPEAQPGGAVLSGGDMPAMLHLGKRKDMSQSRRVIKVVMENSVELSVPLTVKFESFGIGFKDEDG
jgi:hypothetical protein